MCVEPANEKFPGTPKQGWRDIYQVIDITDIYLISIWFLLSKKSTLISWFLVFCGTSVWQCYTVLLPVGYWSICCRTEFTFGFHSMSHVCTMKVTYGMLRTRLGVEKAGKFTFCYLSLNQWTDVQRYFVMFFLVLAKWKIKNEDFEDFIDFRNQIDIKISRNHDFLQEIMISCIPDCNMYNRFLDLRFAM